MFRVEKHVRVTPARLRHVCKKFDVARFWCYIKKKASRSSFDRPPSTPKNVSTLKYKARNYVERFFVFTVTSVSKRYTRRTQFGRIQKGRPYYGSSIRPVRRGCKTTNSPIGGILTITVGTPVACLGFLGRGPIFRPKSDIFPSG